MRSVGATGSRAQTALEIGEELPAVREARQGVGRRLLPGQLEEAAVLAERRGEPHDDQRERQRGQDDREQVHPGEVVVDEDARRDERADGGNGEERPALDLEPLARAVGHPRRRGDEQHRGGPEDVDPRSFHVRPVRRLEEVDGVRERSSRGRRGRGGASAVPGRQPVSEKTPKTAESRSTSPSG